MTHYFKIKAMSLDSSEIIEWLMANYGGEQFNGQWDFPRLPILTGLHFDPMVSLEEVLGPIIFSIHDDELATLFKLTWAHYIIP